LLGKYLGVQLLMAVYVLFMFGFSYLLTWIGGERIQTTPWVLIAYPLVRLRDLQRDLDVLVTMMHPVMAFGLVLVTSVLTFMVSPGARPPAFRPVRCGRSSTRCFRRRNCSRRADFSRSHNLAREDHLGRACHHVELWPGLCAGVFSAGGLVVPAPQSVAD